MPYPLSLSETQKQKKIPKTSRDTLLPRIKLQRNGEQPAGPILPIPTTATLSPSSAAATAAASDVLVLPTPRDRAGERLQEPPTASGPHQEDYEGGWGCADDLGGGPNPLRQGLRALHSGADDKVVVARGGEQEEDAAEEWYRRGDY